MQKVEKASVIIWSLEDVQYLLFRIVAIAIGYYFFNDYDIVRKILIIGTSYYILKFIYEICLNPLYYRNFTYSMDTEMIQTVKGGLTVQKNTIPIRRIQHVDIDQTFYSRFFDLYCLNIYTAGEDHAILFLTKLKAEKLKEEIINLLIEEGIDQDEKEKRSLY